MYGQHDSSAAIAPKIAAWNFKRKNEERLTLAP